MAQMWPDVTLQPVLVEAQQLTRNGYVRSVTRRTERASGVYPSKLAVRKKSCLLGFALAAASRTFGKRPQGRTKLRRVSDESYVAFTRQREVERPNGT